MDLTVVELDFTTEDGGPDTAVGALAGIAFLLAVTVLARWADRHNG